MKEKLLYWMLQIAAILIVLAFVGILLLKEDMSPMRVADAIIHLFLSVMLCIFVRSMRKWFYEDKTLEMPKPSSQEILSGNGNPKEMISAKEGYRISSRIGKNGLEYYYEKC